VRRIFLSLTLLSAACGVSEAGVGSEKPEVLEDLGVHEGSARVTAAQATQAAAIVDSTRAYLPYAYTEDGCYGRALYMSMELAGRRIPTSAQYLTGWLRPSADVEWGWHVAPMVEIDGTSQKTILDPALAPQGPVSLTRWLQLSNPQGSYQLYWTLGNEYVWGARPNAQNAPVIRSFAELQPFRLEDVEHACGVMYDYLANEGSGMTSGKRALLVRRTRTLLNRLSSVGKISGYQSSAAVSCGFTSVPQCRESGACSRNEDCCSMACSGSCQPRPIDVGAATTPMTPMTPSTPGLPTLERGVAAASLSGAKSSKREWQVQVPAGVSQLTLSMTGGSGDADLHVRFGAPATTTAYDFRPYENDANETVRVASPQAGTWYVMVNGYTAYSGVSLTASW